MFRKNLVDALRREQDIKMRITPGSEMAEGILAVLEDQGIKTYIFAGDDIILIHRNKASVRSREYIAVSATEKENSNIIPFMGYDRVKYPEYLPETDMFAADTVESYPNFRDAVRRKREFFVADTQDTIKELVAIALEMGLNMDMVTVMDTILCFALTKGEPEYIGWDTITEGVTERYIPGDDDFIVVAEEELEQIEQGASCETCDYLEDGGCIETEGNCPQQQDNRIAEEVKPESREITFNSESDCHVNGHSLVHMVRFDNGGSVWGEMLCQKCGKIYSWQYDYNSANYVVHEPKPF